MATASEQRVTRPALKYTYRYSGAIVEGLPTRSFFKSQAKYFLQFQLGLGEEWRSREIQTKGNTVSWRAKEDEHQITAFPTAILQVSLYKNHTSRPIEAVGTAEMSLSSWMSSESPTPVSLPSAPNAQQHIFVRLFFFNDDKHAIAEAVARAQALPQPDKSDMIKDQLDQVDRLKNTAENVGNAWDALLSNVTWFMDTMKVVSQVHPYAELAWTAISAAYQLVRAQQQRDEALFKLAELMQRVFKVIRESNEFVWEEGTGRLTTDALCSLASQTEECAQFISAYTKNSSFLGRLLKQIGSSVPQKIKEYNQQFATLMAYLMVGSQLDVVLVTFRIQANLEQLADTMNIHTIPYTSDAGYQSGRRCMDGTRQSLLESIRQWARSEPLSGRIFLLTGPAGTGKSTIAHTVAGEFRAQEKLGSMFCFNNRKQPPANLMRNIARNLCDRNPAYRAALSKAIDKNIDGATTSDLTTLFETLILGPALLAKWEPTFVIIDALDQSGSPAEREELLGVILSRLWELPDNIRFVITSREESDVQRAFPLPTKDLRLKRMGSLRDDDELSQDILKFVRTSLSDVQTGALLHGLPDEACERLAKVSEGLFQWADVACRYIKWRGPGQPVAALYHSVIRGATPGLDALYHTVLSQLLLPESGLPVWSSAGSEIESRLSVFKDVLGIFLNVKESPSIHTVKLLICEGTPWASCDVDKLLEGLGSLLITVGDTASPIQLLHSSLAEFVSDPARAREFHVGMERHHETLALATLRILCSSLHFNMGNVRTSYLLNHGGYGDREASPQIHAELLYSCKYWGYHFSEMRDGVEQNDEMHRVILDFFTTKLLFWIEALSVTDNFDYLMPCLRAARARLENVGAVASSMTTDCLRFLSAFSRPMRESAAHIYLSALVWLPENSQIAQLYRKAQGRGARVVAGQALWWPAMSSVVSRHSFGFTSLAVSHDGKWIATASDEHEVLIWDAKTDQPVGAPLRGHEAPIISLAFSDDGQWLVSGSEDETVRLWDMRTYESRSLVGHTHFVSSVMFSPDGRRIVSGSRDCHIRIWETQSSKGRISLVGHRRQVNSCGFSPSGERVISASEDRTIRIWDASTGQPVGDPLRGHEGPVNTAIFTPDGSHILSCSDDATLRRWLIKGDEITCEAQYQYVVPIISISLSRDGLRAVSRSPDRTVCIWDAVSCERIGLPLSGHTSHVSGVAFLPDGRSVVSVSEDRTVRLWDTDLRGVTAQRKTGHAKSINVIAFSPDGDWIASASDDMSIRMWDAHSGEALTVPFVGHTGPVQAIAFSPDGEHIISGSNDRTIRIWDAYTGSPLWEPLTGHTGTINSVAFSPDGMRIVSGSADGSIQVWDGQTGSPVGTIVLDPPDSVSTVVFLPDSRQIASESEDGHMAVWDSWTGEFVAEPSAWHRWAKILAFSPDRKRLATVSTDNTISIWESSFPADSDGEQKYSPLEDGNADQPNASTSTSDPARGMLLVAPPVDKLRWSGSNFSLSPAAAHQLKQPYNPPSQPAKVIQLDVETGWIRSGTDYLFWTDHTCRLEQVRPRHTMDRELHPRGQSRRHQSLVTGA